MTVTQKTIAQAVFNGTNATTAGFNMWPHQADVGRVILPRTKS
jgi:hypothetical protein